MTTRGREREAMLKADNMETAIKNEKLNAKEQMKEKAVLSKFATFLIECN